MIINKKKFYKMFCFNVVWINFDVLTNYKKMTTFENLFILILLITNLVQMKFNYQNNNYKASIISAMIFGIILGAYLVVLYIFTI